MPIQIHRHNQQQATLTWPVISLNARTAMNPEQ
jgi:hypothetical protein